MIVTKISKMHFLSFKIFYLLRFYQIQIFSGSCGSLYFAALKCLHTLYIIDLTLTNASNHKGGRVEATTPAPKDKDI